VKTEMQKNKSNPYYIDEDCIYSTSGGRSSMYSLVKTVKAHNGVLPDYIKPVFCNTGKERNETLDFVHRCEKELSINIVWIELSKMIRNDGKYQKEYKIVNYETASRNGEPFQILLDAMPAIPNVVNMSCTAYLKTRLMRMYADDIGFDRGCLTVIGMRADEFRRVRNSHGKKVEGFEGYCPMHLDGVTQSDVRDFWDSMPWNLELPMLPDGSCPAGNCDICYKKSLNKRELLIAQNPEKADFWIKAEEDKKQRFRPDQPSYKQMKDYAASQLTMFSEYDDDSMPCFCGD
jgi:3'-phosphoadenosine 5'-phosphosulfate sulfotransferase (PAPS reductase)/FAD synthetase